MITHGGNNTVTESFHHGKPMVCLPLFWDQVDNAQRLAETGFGARLPAYAFEPDELTGAIDRLLGDRGLADRLAAIATRLQANPGTVRAADLIERLARDGRAGHRLREGLAKVGRAVQAQRRTAGWNDLPMLAHNAVTIESRTGAWLPNARQDCPDKTGAPELRTLLEDPPT